MKIILLIFTFFIICQNTVYSFEIKDCYFIHKSSYAYTSKNLDKNFNRKKFDYYIYSIDKNKKTLTWKWSLTDEEYKRRLDYWKKEYGEAALFMIKKDFQEILKLEYLDENEAKVTNIQSEFRKEIQLNFKEKKVYFQQFKNGEFFSKSILQCK
tara:strand:- start:254 stop:715 length:462 start_codon:yes stop_codon:yes gene_type:complete